MVKVVCMNRRRLKRGPKGRRPTPEGPREREFGFLGRGFLRRGQRAPPHQLGCLGSAVSSPSGVRGRAQEEVGFGAFLSFKHHQFQ